MSRRTTSDRPLLAARGLVFEAGGQRLIDGLDLDVHTGRRLVILGANGAGKSVTLRLLHGLLTPAAGRILWDGRSLDAAARRAQALVFQRPVMLRRSVRANLRFALSTRVLSLAERQVREDDALDRARLTDLADRPARLLSVGEQQRLAVARALACKPRLLLLDEPTASLDPASTLAVEELVCDAQADGVTIVLVTHDAGQARRIGDDAVFLHAGRVAEAGPAADVLERPSSEAARAWLEGRIYLSSIEDRGGRKGGRG
ncbi:MAG: ATP-binding cassette domain-containing protein [Pseudomonadota bacterium]